MKKFIRDILTINLIIILLTGCNSKTSDIKSNITTTNNSNNTEYTSVITDTDKVFTERDLKQEVDVSDATKYEVKDNEDITITKEGIYVISGSAKNVSIIVEVDDESKVQLVLNNLNITNTDSPCIYVKNTDKLFVTTEGENNLSVTGEYNKDGETNLDATIFSKDDLVLNGTGILNIKSTANGITSKDDLKITGGTINIDCTSDALEANNSISIADGTITINTKKDGLHAEYEEDNNVGNIYIKGGTLKITAGDDGIHGTTYVQIDGGTFDITASEGIEGTYIQINDGTININASDDGINAAKKSNITTPTVEINGGTTTIKMGQGDTDGVDSNGNIIINGGTIDVTGQSTFDYDGSGTINGGTVISNGSQITTLPNQMMGGHGGGQTNGGMRGNMGQRMMR